MSTNVAERVYNFSAGPAVLPLPVLEQIQSEMVSLPGIGSSVLEISHRSDAFKAIIDDCKERLIRLLNVPDTHDVLFLQGGGRFQNAMIPMNFLQSPSETADYVVTGSWGKKSSDEVHHFGKLNVAFDGAPSKFNRTPTASELKLTDGAAYVHLTSNETIQGVQFAELPDVGGVPIVSDNSSDFMCGPMDVSRYGLVYACAQKNAGTAGVTIVIVRKDLMERAGDRLPGYLSYASHSKGGSMFNTPPTFSIYVTGLVCKWLEEEMGGLAASEKINREKSKLIYDLIDGSEGFYSGDAEKNSRSFMNVVFKMNSDELDAQFVAQAAEAGLATLKGHRSLGGIRASIYNAMPKAGVNALVSFMKDFANKNG